MMTGANPGRGTPRRFAAWLAISAMIFAGACAAQTAWKPERAVEIVVGSAPGGGNDKTGTLRMIGVASTKRLAALPEVPTLKEQGFDIVQGGWTLIVGPNDLSPAQVAYWENLLERTVNHPAWKRSLEDDSAEWLFVKAQQTREFLKKEYDTDRALLVELGMVK